VSQAPTAARRASRSLSLIALLAFLSLGLPDGVLGVAWPSLRRSFGLPMDQLGLLLWAAAVGYLGSSVASGALVARLGLGRTLVASSAATAASVLGFALAPHWSLVVASSVVAGLGAGAIDAGVNVFAAARLTPRWTTWLHASYGVGAALGPLLTAVILARTSSWRLAYAAIGLVLGLMTLAFAGTAERWTVDTRPARSVSPGPTAVEVLRRPAVWMSLLLFFVYAGLEVGAGQWSYTWLVEGRRVPAGTGAAWLAVYWGSLTAGRIALGALADRVRARIILRMSLAAVPVGVLVLWMGVGPAAGATGLMLIGFALAPIFPLLIAATPDRVGAAHVTQAVGFQVAAFYVGSAVLPGAAGLLAHRFGLDVLGPFLLVTAVALGALCSVGSSGAGRRPVSERRSEREPGRPFVVSNPASHQEFTRHAGRHR
jgi:fucose permease